VYQAGPTFLIERNDFAVQDHVVGRQRFQTVEPLRIIERLLVARDEPHSIAVLEGQYPITVELDLVQPIAVGEFGDSERLHWFDERWAAGADWFHGAQYPAAGEPNDRTFDDSLRDIPSMSLSCQSRS
jgi:hypothetical protein